MAIPAGYTQNTNGFFYYFDGSGPYTMDAAGVMWVVGATNPTKAASVTADVGGLSQAIAISGVHAVSTALVATYVLLTPTVDCFFRQGAAPVALATGVDMFLVAGATYRVKIISGQKFSIITAGGTTGTAYITPEA